MAEPTTAVEGTKDFGTGPAGKVSQWRAEIKAYEKKFGPWHTRSAKIIKRYRDERESGQSDDGTNQDRKINILWSNIQTLQPAVLSRTAKPEVTRRFRDRDPIGRTASTVLERATRYCQDIYDFDGEMEACRDDYLLTARGQGWVRYTPYFGDPRPRRIDLTEQLTLGQLAGRPVEPSLAPTYLGPDGTPVDPKLVKTDEAGPFMDGEPYRPLLHEEVQGEHVTWNQFGHTVAPKWSKVRAVWKWEYMTYDELVARFGKEIADKVPLNTRVENIEQDDVDSHGTVFKRAKVYEIWDKTTRKAIWICLDYREAPLEEVDDPLKLRGFFPCPKPLYGTITTDSLVPVPDYVEYQDQADELDVLTERIHLLTSALRVAGVRDSQFEELEGLLSDTAAENKLYPVSQWAAFAEKGGLKSAISFLPLAEIATTLAQLVQQRAQIKQDLYEVTGISDIIRGQTDPRETKGAQQIKAQFGSLRLQDRQRAMARFIRDMLRLMAEIAADTFQPTNLALMSGYELTEHANAEEFTQAVELLKSDRMRTFRLDIETDSTIALDEQQEKADRTELLTAVGGVIERAVMAAEKAPWLGPMLAETILFAMRGFRIGRELEQTVEEAVSKLREMGQQQAPGAQGGAAAAEAQAAQQAAMIEMQTAQATAHLEVQKRQAIAATEIEVQRARAQTEMLEAQGRQAELQRAAQLAAEQHAYAMMELAEKRRVLETRAQADATKARAGFFGKLFGGGSGETRP